ncbi:Hsp70 family protein [Actinoplanes sp. NPDC051494]|uniref:Hsp70 family protein n=1 Tax=Actinoplanes sp. NPDC051494 TaxID=3363907 RepID=UPI00378EE9A4
MLGVDLGTSHTVAMVRRPDGRVRPLLFDGQPLLPSAVYLDTTGRLHVGRDAVRLGYAEPARLEPNPKRHIDAGTILLGGAEVPVADLFAALLGAVAREAVATVGHLPPAVVTYPAAWGTQRQEVLVTALSRAGWPPGTPLVPEPVAAARYFAEVLRRPVPVGEALAVFDFGGGTLDIAVVRNTGGGTFEVAASGGLDDLGGLDLDAALVDHLGTTLRREEPQAWAALSEPTTLAQWRARRRFWDDVRGAKEMLSRVAQAPVPVPGVETALQLTREELEMVAAPLIRRGVAEANTIIEAAGTTPADLVGLFLVGGSSRVPLVARLLHSELGIAPTVLEQPELPAAEGSLLAAAAQPANLPDKSDMGAGAGGAVPAAGTAEPSAEAAPGDSQAAVVVPAADTATQPEGPAPAAAQEEAMAPDPGSSPAIADPSATTLTAARPVPTSPPAETESSALGDPAASGPSAVTDLSGRADLAATTPFGEGAQTATAPLAGSRAPGGVAASQAAGAASFAVGRSAGAAPDSGDKPAATRPFEGPVASAPSLSGEPQYAEPVDPWATGEAAALAAGHGGGSFPVSGAPAPAATSWLASTEGDDSKVAPLPAYKRKGLWIVAALTVVVLGAAAGVVAWFWPGYPALEYQSLSDPKRVAPVSVVTSSFSSAALRDGRAYFAAAQEDGQLGIVAADADSGKTEWKSVVGRLNSQWDYFFSLPHALVAISAVDSSAGSTRLMVLVDPGSGETMWERRVASDDEVLFTGDTAVLVDRTENRVVGLKIKGKGEVGWEKKSPVSQYGLSTTKVVVASTVEDFAGAASVEGLPFAKPFGDERRIVQIGVDRSARVIDAASGAVVAGPESNVAEPDDEVIAHNGRLIVAESGDARRVLAYDLGKLGEPRVLYTPPDTNTRLSGLTACGADRVCAVQETGYDAKTAQVVAIDAAKGGQLWHRVVASTEVLVPVGEAVLATQSTSPAQVTLIDGDGKELWIRAGVVGRIDAGNILQFSKALSGSADDPALAGEHVGDGPVQLGPLVDVRSASCAWDERHLACAGEKDFQIQTFSK